LDLRDDFVEAYVRAAMSCLDPDPGSGEYCADTSILPDTVWTLARKGCSEFWAALADKDRAFLLEIADDGGDDPWIEHAGRDLYYGQNGHGCGFWDGDWDGVDDYVVKHHDREPDTFSERLDALSTAQGTPYQLNDAIEAAFAPIRGEP